jgi:hypothetical protein
MLRKSAIRPFVVAISFLLFFLSVSGAVLGIPIALSGKADFRAFYTAGYMVRSGHRAQLYDYEQNRAFENEVVTPADGGFLFNHLAYEVILYAPLSIFRYRTAYALFFGINLAVLVGSFWMLRRYLSSLEEVWTLLPVAIFACFLPVTLALLQGQDSIILLALMISVSLMVDRQEDFKGGVILGLTLFKFQYALPIVFLFMIWRRWRFLLGFALSAGAVISISLWITGLAGFVSYTHSLVEMSAKFSSVFSDRYGIRPQFMPNVRGLAYMVTNGSPLGTHILVLVLSGLVLARTAMRRPSVSLALLAALLVSYHELISDMVLMILPLGWALSDSVLANGKDAVRLATISGVIFGGPTILLLAGDRFYVLAIPVMALVAIWNDQRVALVASPNQAV